MSVFLEYFLKLPFFVNLSIQKLLKRNGKTKNFPWVQVVDYRNAEMQETSIFIIGFELTLE